MYNNYAVPNVETTYSCHTFPLPLDQDRHIVAFEVVRENVKVLHHILVYSVPTDLAPGYNECGGMPATGPSPPPTAPFSSFTLVFSCPPLRLGSRFQPLCAADQCWNQSRPYWSQVLPLPDALQQPRPGQWLHGQLGDQDMVE